MAEGTVKKSKFRKFPKAPKATASADVWSRYLARVEETARYNQEKKDYITIKKAVIDKVRERVTCLKNGTCKVSKAKK